ncbi:MAG: 16S rRNA (uracil(1498)-N(3))-methyltransferase [Pseudomonadota bacterium]|nr:16S rRNA (uracil(1498)-N(3))-methyltransferase [Pseudomonadota bacterium]
MTAPAIRARLFVTDDLAAGASLRPSREQQHYLLNVMRCRNGEAVLLFNGRDGEWRAELEREGRRDCQLLVRQATRQQTSSPDLWLLFAPVKKARLDFIAQKASEMGCSRIWPVRTDHCQVSRVNDDRMLANVIEAAEQTERLDIAEITPFTDLAAALDSCETERRIIFCDEASAGDGDMNAIRVLADAAPIARAAIVIGPEGGFSEAERAMISGRQNSLKLSLGPRILRADTAAIAALACFQSVCGDWV